MVHLIHLPKVTQLERTGIIDFSPGPLIQNATCFSTLFLILCVVKIREKSRLAFSATPLLRGKESSAGPDSRCWNPRNRERVKETFSFRG